MNSKVEYNRCSIPRIQMKFGNKTIVEDDEITAKEKEIIETIKNMAKGDKKRLSSRVNEPNSSKHKKPKVDKIDIDDVTENAANDTPVLVEAKNDVMKNEKPIVNPIVDPTDVNIDDTDETVVENTIAVENEVTNHAGMNLNGHLNITTSGCSNNLSNHIDAVENLVVSNYSPSVSNLVTFATTNCSKNKSSFPNIATGNCSGVVGQAGQRKNIEAIDQGMSENYFEDEIAVAIKMNMSDENNRRTDQSDEKVSQKIENNSERQVTNENERSSTCHLSSKIETPVRKLISDRRIVQKNLRKFDVKKAKMILRRG